MAWRRNGPADAPYPTKLITIVVPFQPAAPEICSLRAGCRPTQAFTRAADHQSKNKTGASGNIGAESVFPRSG